MSLYKQLSYNQRIDVVRRVQFSVLGPEEIIGRSVVEVTKTDTYSGNEPVIGGLFDPRMGVLEHNRNCSTCEQKNTFCPGHFAHIKLASPVYHPMFFDMIRKLLKCICFRCSRPFASMRSSQVYRDEIVRIRNIKTPKKRWDAFVALCSNTKISKRCGDDCENEDGCRAKQPSRYLKENPMKIIAEWKSTEETITKELTPTDILHIFQRITDEDIELMGFHTRWNRPEWMICTVLPVPPPAVRPSIIEDNGQRREDDLTHKLSDIVKYNNQLQARIDSGKGTEEQLKVLTNLIQYHIATFMDNTIPGLPVAQQRNGRKLKSVADRLKKKEGRIRGNLNGKRVDQSARSVITPDPVISLDELGVPYRIAMNITFPEIVNSYNVEEMQMLVRNGPDVWPGAKYMRSITDGITITLKYADRDKIANELKYGDIIDRHLRDGDYILFNRQPSLHKMSMMCHKVKIMPYQTFRLPVLVTNGYNADFDGDEMNLFQSQNVQTMSELMDLAAVPYMIIAPRDGKPILEVVQDTMLGAFRITKDWIRIHDKTMANLQMVNNYFTGALPPPADTGAEGGHGLYTGKQAYSQILPPHLFAEMKNKAGESFKIVNSEIVSGTIDKTVYHALSRGLIPILYHDYSPFEVRRLLDNTQRLICKWLMTAGFSVGISDLVVEPATNKKLKDKISEFKKEAYSKVEDVRKGKMENKSIFSNEDFFEREILNVLNELTNQVGKIGLSHIEEKTNRMINMVKSGSKGKETNVAQIIACVGQQNVDGKRVAYGFTDRTLPHFTKYDDGPDARGFVENSFISGLSPQEVFFHAMGGREGLIDTAVKTSETGYIQRRLVKAMEDCKIYYDQTVRNATGAIVQYMYGEDGIDGIRIENQYIPYITMNQIEIDIAYNIRPEDPLDLHITPEAMDEVRRDPSWIDKARLYMQAILDDRIYLITHIFDGEDNKKIQYPIPFDRIIGNAIKREMIVTGKKKGVDAAVPTNLTPGHVYDTIAALTEKLRIIQPNQGVRFLHILLRVHLSPKTLIFEHHMSRAIFDYVVYEIERYFMQAIAHAGEMVGIIAAQSIGELSTQQSVTGDTIVKIVNNSTTYVGEIARYIDRLIDENPRRVHRLAKNLAGMESVVLNIPRDHSFIVSVSTAEKLKWSSISQVSRHPANGNLIKVTTQSGRTVTATLSHSFLMRNCYGITEIRGALLRVGDRIPVARFIPIHVHCDKEIADNYKISTAAEDDIIPCISEILTAINIDGGSKRNYTRTDLRKLIAEIKPNENNRSLLRLIQQAIDGDVIYEEIVSIETIIDPKVYVYDFTVPGNESFMVNDGIMVHNTLDSFHSSGTAAAVKATSGVPRLKELLSVSKNIKTPTLVIYMKPDISMVVNPLVNEDGKPIDTRVQDAKTRSMKIMQQLEITCLADILESTEIYWDPSGNNGLMSGLADDNEILAVYREFSNIECQRARSQSPWVLRMKIDKDKMYRIGLTMLDIYMRINTSYGQSVDCVFSDDNAPELIMRIRLTKDVLKDIDPDDAIAALKAMEYNLTHSVLLKGLKGIKKVSMRTKTRKRYNVAEDRFDTISEWLLDTDGTNLIDILANPNIDAVRTRSNDIYEIYQVLGIEAARNALYEEFMEVVGSDSINYRHMSLLLDTMTNRGTLMSVDRHGINRGDVGPLAKSSFEETTDMLINASIFSELDHINGVSANIMLGQLPPCGTGDHDVLIDEVEYMKLLKESGEARAVAIKMHDEPEPPNIYDEKRTCGIEEIASKYKTPRKTKAKMSKPNVSFI